MLAPSPVNSHGWGRYARGLMAALVETEPAMRVRLIASVDSPMPADLGLPVTSYHRVLPSITGPRGFSTLQLLGAIPSVHLLATRADLVHVLAEPYAVAALSLRKPLIVTAHGSYVPLSTGRQRTSSVLYRRVYGRARIVAVSRYTAQQVRLTLPAHVAVTVIPNGVDIERFQTQPAELPAKRGPTILAVGQVKARKGFHILAAAMKAIRDAIPDAEAVFIGDTETYARYVRAIRERLAADGTAEAVRWLGRVPESVLLSWFAAADVFALPALNVGGRFEGFGLVYLEASAAGLPVIGTLGCGAEDAIRDGETGMLIAQDDHHALAGAAIRLLKDAALRARMGEAGRRHAATHTWQHVAEQTLRMYRDHG